MEAHVEEMIIPGLPDDIAMECLIRVPKIHAYKLGMVSKLWKSAAATPQFFRQRHQLLHSRSNTIIGLRGKFILLLQEEDKGLNDHIDDEQKKISSIELAGPSCRLLFYDIEKRKWKQRRTLAGDFPAAKLPKSSVISMTGENLVVMGDLTMTEPREEWPSRTHVWVYSFKKEEWRVGAPIPGPRRVFFAHASDGLRTVFVAGGYVPATDETLRSAMAYDVERDEWSRLPPMIWNRSFCYGTFFGGKFYVATEKCCMEAFDLTTFSWISKAAPESDHEFYHENVNPVSENFGCQCFRYYSSASRLWMLEKTISTPGVRTSRFDKNVGSAGGGHVRVTTLLHLEHPYEEEGWFEIETGKTTRHTALLPREYSSPVRGICLTNFLPRQFYNRDLFTCQN